LKTINFGLNINDQGVNMEMHQKRHHFKKIEEENDHANDGLVSNVVQVTRSQDPGLPIQICSSALCEVLKDVLATADELKSSNPSTPASGYGGSVSGGGGGGGGGYGYGGGSIASSVGSNHSYSGPSYSANNTHHHHHHHRSTSEQRRNEKNEKSLLAQRVCNRAALMFADIEPVRPSQPPSPLPKEGGDRDHQDQDQPLVTAESFFESNFLMSADAFVLFSRFVVSMAVRFSAQK
jgi:hypothetical protein